MYCKYCWGFGGNEEQKEAQKEQLKEVLESLGAKVTIENITEDLFTIEVTK